MRVFMGASVIVDETEAGAAALLAEYRHYASGEGALVHASASMGIDLAAYGMDEPIGDAPTEAIQSNVAQMKAERMTKRRLLERMVLGSRQVPIVGTAGQVADRMLAALSEAGVDGFVLSRTVVPECFEAFVDLVVPELQRRGMFKEAYAGGTLRGALFGRDRLPGTHPAAAVRWG